MNSEQYASAVEAAITALLQQRATDAPTPEAKEMVERMSTLILRAGKRSRPKLLELTYRGYGGTDIEQLVDIGVALELQHQFLLVHDDIMDDDTVRYDGPNILGMYRADYPEEHWDIASSMALMAGNLLYTYACQAILDHPTLSADKKVAILSIIQDTNIGVHVGQQLDVLNLAALNPDIDEAKLETTDYYKTALYTVRQPMIVAAELLDIDAEERQKIDAFARAYGILYQMVDDYADYFETGTAFDAHPKYRDFRQGKITYPLLENVGGDSELSKQITVNFGKKTINHADITQIINKMSNFESKSNISFRIDYCKNAVAKMKISKDAVTTFEELVLKLVIF